MIEIKNIKEKGNILLAEPTKEELVDEILRLREENEILKKKLETKNTSEKFVTEKKKLKKHWEPLGRPEGHPGTTRIKPIHIDHEINQTLDVCPDCGQNTLSELPSEKQIHIQEDIIPVKIEAAKFVRHEYWCSNCKEKKAAPYAAGEIPYGYLGPNILIQSVLMKYHHGLSYDKMRMMFKDFHNLEVTPSALAQALQRMGRWLNVEEAVILEAIRSSPYVHMDETGWKIAGSNHWLWDIVNDRLALYRIRVSRGQKVPEEILTKDYHGIVISDFLSAYNKSGKKRQRCLVHLVREMKKCRELDRTEESQKAYSRLNRIIKDAYRLDNEREKLNVVIFFRRFHLVKERLFNFACDTYKSGHWERISKRLLKYYEEIFTFLEVKGLPSHNNHAERMIRPNVIFRKISFQNMSIKGAQAHEVLMSLLQTLRLQKQNPIAFFKEAYLKHRQGDLSPILALSP